MTIYLMATTGKNRTPIGGRYGNRFPLVRVTGSEPRLLDGGHAYLPLHSAVQRRTV